MDLAFIGGSMGSVVGEKIARAMDYAVEHKIPMLMISKSGGGAYARKPYFADAIGKTSAVLPEGQGQSAFIFRL